MGQLQNIADFCLKCRVRVPERFSDGSLTLEQARSLCASCRFGKSGIYKFDIAFHLFLTVQSVPSASERPKGKKSTYTKRYGTAVSKLHKEGKTTRQIAEILGISPTSVTKILREILPNNENQDLSDIF